MLLISILAASSAGASNLDSLKNVIEKSVFEDSHDARLRYFGILVHENRLAEADSFIHQCLELSKEQDDLTSQVQYSLSTSILQRQYLNYDSAYSILFRCLDKINAIEERDSMLQQIYNLFGIYLYDKGDALDAILYFNKAVSVCTTRSPNSPFLVHAYNNLAVMSLNIEQYEDGLKYCNLAQRLVDANEGYTKLKLFHNKALIYSKLGQHDSASFYFDLSFQQLKITPAPAIEILGLSEYMTNGKALEDKALQDSIAQKLHMKLNGIDGMTMENYFALSSFSTMHEGRGDLDSAIFYAREAYRVAEQQGISFKQREAAGALISLYGLVNEKDSIIRYLNIHRALTNSIDNERDKLKLLELRSRLNLWAKDRIIFEERAELESEKSRKRMF